MRAVGGTRATAAGVASAVTSALAAAAVLAVARHARAVAGEPAQPAQPAQAAPAAQPAASPQPAAPAPEGGPVRTVGEATNELTVAQLAAEQARKASLEARGITVITSSGTLVTLLLALGAISAKVESLTLGTATVAVVLAALACFVAAAVAGIACNAPRAYAGVKTYTHEGNRNFADGRVELDEQPPGLDWYLVEKHYWLPVAEVERQFAIYRVEELDDARKANNGKARALAVGIVAEVAAVVLVSVAVGLILFGRLG